MGIRKREPEDSDAFWEFWQEYPRADGKRAARKAYDKALKRASAAEIISGLRCYPFSADPKYHPMPTTFINQDRFRVEDPIIAQTVRSDSHLLTDSIQAVLTFEDE